MLTHSELEIIWVEDVFILIRTLDWTSKMWFELCTLQRADAWPLIRGFYEVKVNQTVL